MSNWSKEQIQEAISKVSAKAATDEKFRALCNKDIYAAIQEVTGNVVPSSFKINVVDNTGYHISLTLPPVAREDGELAESELESVAGGSKSGATQFFNDVANTASGVAGTIHDASGGVISVTLPKL